MNVIIEASMVTLPKTKENNKVFSSLKICCCFEVEKREIKIILEIFSLRLYHQKQITSKSLKQKGNAEVQIKSAK